MRDFLEISSNERANSRFKWTFMLKGWKCNLVFTPFNEQNNSILRFLCEQENVRKNFFFSVKWFCFQAAYEIRMEIWLGSPIHTEQRKSMKIFVFSMNNYLWNVQITVLFRCFCLKGGLFLRHSDSSRLTNRGLEKPFLFRKHIRIHAMKVVFPLDQKKTGVSTCTSFVARVKLACKIFHSYRWFNWNWRLLFFSSVSAHFSPTLAFYYFRIETTLAVVNGIIDD